MPGFTLTNRAKADLKEIGAYTQAQWGREQRNIYLTMLDSSFHLLALNSLKGTDCSDILKGYRKLKTGSHLIFYHTSSEESIEIVRILHERMEIETKLSEK